MEGRGSQPPLGYFNPYQELIRGDWFNPKGREHHRGAVYLNGDWLIEATKLDEVMAPAGTAQAWLNKAGGEYLLNVAWLQPANMARVPGNSFTAKNGTQNAPCSEGGECVGFILHGHWVTYEQVDFGQNANQLEIRAASASRGGVIEVRLDAPDAELVGSCSVPNTGDWQSWESFKVGIKPVSGVRTLCLVFKGSSFAPAADEALLWYAKVDADHTTLGHNSRAPRSEAKRELNSDPVQRSPSIAWLGGAINIAAVHTLSAITAQRRHRT